MTINNQNKAAWIKFAYYLFTFLYLAAIVLFLYLDIDNQYIVIGLMSAVFVAAIIISLSLSLNYIIYKVSDNKIILRYYPLHPFHENFKSIEIPKSSFAYFEINSKIMGLKPELILFQQTKNGIAKYPPICLSALAKKDVKKITNSLQHLSTIKKH
ncbi:hypothetical protein ACT3CE_14000 [Marinifilum sp. RC60d5]|uniref:hypothetical protein n=1 Tax=Marinifilum sp. RC60d5 TaxID=3458414 RepID=UPI00403566F1